MAEAVFMPRLGQSVESCIITRWEKKKGDIVEEGDVLFCYETDKASFDEIAKVSGILLEFFYEEGDEVPVLANVAVIGKAGESVDAFRSSSPTTSAVELSAADSVNVNPLETSQHDASVETPSDEKIRISPRARCIAQAKGISIQGLHGSGPNGRIIVRDVESAGLNAPKAEPAVLIVPKAEPEAIKTVKAEQNVSTPAFAPIISNDDFVETPLSNMRKLIAKGMHASLQNSAQLTHHTSADARKLLELRASYKVRAEKGEIPNITLNDLVCYATVRALEKMPAINSHFLGDRTKTFKKVHLGIAVDTDRGLMVPVIRNADDLKLKALATQMKAMAENCRKGNVDPELLRSENASFTISNLGAYGIELFTPVINLPQSGILGVNTITYRPADIGNGIIAFIPVIGLSLTYDHRALDGAPASAFLKEIRNQIENLSNDLV
jgi:pyruvate dehydrogenase E2 component (dihydrolipoamide acetyltransferase)